MTVRSTIQAALRKVVGSDLLGESMHYRQQELNQAGHARAFGSWTSIVGSLRVIGGRRDYSTERDDQVVLRTAVLHIADDAQELNIGDQIKDPDSQVWGIVGKERHEGYFHYELEAEDFEVAGPDRRARS